MFLAFPSTLLVHSRFASILLGSAVGSKDLNSSLRIMHHVRRTVQSVETQKDLILSRHSLQDHSTSIIVMTCYIDVN